MFQHTPEQQLENLSSSFKGKAASGEPFSPEGAAHFLSGMRKLGREIEQIRGLADGYEAKCAEVDRLKLELKIYELREAEVAGTIKQIDFPLKPSIRIIPIRTVENYQSELIRITKDMETQS